MNVHHLYFHLVHGTCMDKAFQYRFISILQLNVFTYQTNGDLTFWIFQFVKIHFPFIKIGFIVFSNL